MLNKKKILGLDVGDKRIGIALSDSLWITAQGVETYTRKDENSDINYITELYRQSGAGSIVCGFPKNMNGTVGPQAEKVKDFAEKLAKSCETDIIYWDERLSTVYAERMLIDADVSRAKRRKVIDKLAAVAILQSYLSSMS